MSAAWVKAGTRPEFGFDPTPRSRCDGSTIGIRSPGHPDPRGLGGADESGETFFETRIRPVLATDCLPCHGGKKTESGLKVDSRESLLKGAIAARRLWPASPKTACSSGRSDTPMKS